MDEDAAREDAARRDHPRRPSARREAPPWERTPAAPTSWASILERHGKVALRFLQLCLGDPVAGSELYRRFARDRLRGDPEPGPLRELMALALIRLVNNHVPPIPPPPCEATPPPFLATPPPPLAFGPSRGDPRRAHFDAIWREELLTLARRRLKDLEARTGAPLYTALRLRGDAPGLSSAELARQIGPVRGRLLSADEAHQVLQRARIEFSRLLLEEVVATLPDGAPIPTIERELIETGLLAFCREAFARSRPGPDPGR